MPKGWRKEQSRDRFFRKAKEEGYRARSAYKLEEINKRFHVIKPGSRVLDLGAAPGSWSQVAVRLAGKGGKVVALDIEPIAPLAGVLALQGDILQPATQRAIAAALPRGADVVLSDVSPRISGMKLADHARSIELATASLQLALRFLHLGGAFVVKVFEGEDLNEFVALMRGNFESARLFKPEASRGESNEQYVIGLRKKTDGGQRTANGGPMTEDE